MLDQSKVFSIKQSLLVKEVPFRNRPIRFMVLTLLSLAGFSIMYAFNNPQALQDTIMTDLQITQTQFNLLYTIIALPNLFFPLFVGIAVDFVGVRSALVGLMFCAVIFQGVIALGGIQKSYQTMLIGRMLFGIAMESVAVTSTCFVSYWFLGKELAFSIGLVTTLPELGSALNSVITPLIYENTQSLGAPLLTSVGLCFIGFLSACGAAYIDKIADNQDIQHNLRVITDDEDILSEAEPEGIKLKDLKQLKGVFWILMSLCMVSMGQYIPFLDNVSKLIQVRFCFSQLSAGKSIMITYLVTSFLGLPLGILVDKIGYKRYLIMIGMGVFLVAHMIIYLYPQCDFIGTYASWSGASWGLLILGLGYCFYANCIIPSVPIIVSKKITGSAFGIMIVFQNFAMAICPIITAQIIESSSSKQRGYKLSSLFFMCLGIVGVAISFSLFCIKEYSKKLLDGTSDEKKVYAIRLNPSASDDEYIRRLKTPQLVSFNSLNERLVRTYEHIDINTVDKQNGKEIEIFQL